MTPAAVTPAARSARKGAVRPNAHPRPVRARPAPSVPRRVSGPIRSQPASARQASAASRAAEFIRGLPDHPLLDRLVRGRAWIPVLGVMLAGIVAMQVELLKLNASMGRSIALATSLQARNELLRTSVSALSGTQRIERLATRMGMVMPGPTAVDFLHGQASAGRAAAGIHLADAAAFDSALQASGAQVSAATTPAVAPSATAAATMATPAATTTTTTTQAAPSTAATSTPTTAPATSTATTPAAPTAGGAAATGTTATTPSATSGTTNPGGAAPVG